MGSSWRARRREIGGGGSGARACPGAALDSLCSVIITMMMMMIMIIVITILLSLGHINGRKLNMFRRLASQPIISF